MYMEMMQLFNSQVTGWIPVCNLRPLIVVNKNKKTVTPVPFAFEDAEEAGWLWENMLSGVYQDGCGRLQGK